MACNNIHNEKKGGQRERKEERKKRAWEKKTRGEQQITITSKDIYTENQFAVFPREVAQDTNYNESMMQFWHGNFIFPIHVNNRMMPKPLVATLLVQAKNIQLRQFYV